MKHKLLGLAVSLGLAVGFALAAQGEDLKAPIVYLPFDEIKDGKTPNLGSVYADALVEGVDPMEGKFGKAARFFGGDSKVEILLNLNEAAPNGLTVSVWLKCDDMQDGYGTILGAGPGYRGMYLRVRGADVLDCSFAGVWHTILTGHYPSFCKEWTHVVVTYDRKIGRLYLDGDLMGEKSVEYTPDYGTTVSVGRLGLADTRRDPVTGLPTPVFYPYKGGMDDLKIFDYALTPEQAAKLDR